jgi:hypothetical protein
MEFTRNKDKLAFLGRLFGRMALKEFTQDQSPIKRNVPTLSEPKVENSASVTTAIRKLRTCRFGQN